MRAREKFLNEHDKKMEKELRESQGLRMTKEHKEGQLHSQQNTINASSML